MTVLQLKSPATDQEITVMYEPGILHTLEMLEKARKAGVISAADEKKANRNIYRLSWIGDITLDILKFAYCNDPEAFAEMFGDYVTIIQEQNP